MAINFIKQVTRRWVRHSLRTLYCAAALVIKPAVSFGHGGSTILEEGFSGNYGMTALYRSKSIVAPSERYLVPGFFMGGEAFAQQRLMSLADAALLLSYRSGAGYLSTKLESHGHDGPELGEGYLGYQLTRQLALEAGLMDSKLSLANGKHLFQLDGAHPLLGHEVLWGSVFSDEMLRLRWRPAAAIEVGLEILSGRSYPLAISPSSGPGAVVYSSMQYPVGGHSFQIGLGVLHGSASERIDERYSSEHSHGVDKTEVPYFAYDGLVTGATTTVGWTYAGQQGLGCGLVGEFMLQKSSGTLRDESRLSPLQYTYNSYRIDSFFDIGSHRLRARAERLRHRNSIDGSAAEALAAIANLAEHGDPERLSLAYRYQYSKPLDFRFELIRDHSSRIDVDIVSLSINWFDSFIAGQH